MEWLDRGQYTYQWEHPPLARVAVALGPYLAGLRSHSLPGATDEGNAILSSNGNYQHNLMLARFGTLPFLVLACSIIFLWARRWFTVGAGLWAIALFSTCPPVLGHAALATLDVACAATLIAALYALMLWLESPGWAQSLRLAIFCAVAFLTKFSTLPFFVVCCAAASAYLVLRRRPSTAQLRRQITTRVGKIGVIACVILFLLWSGYRFSLIPLADSSAAHTSSGEYARAMVHRSAPYSRLLTTPLPLVQFVRGVRALYVHNAEGTDSFLLGQYRSNGWWYFFLVVLGVKTPLGFLILWVAGAILCWSRGTTWQRVLTGLFPVAIILFCMTSRIDLGVRHILAVYPFFALLGGHCMASLVSRGLAKRSTILALALASTVLWESWANRPDFLAYFNQLAGKHPENLLAESDLDWGQDLQRLSWRLKERGVKFINLRYFGTAPLDLVGLPAYHIISPDERVTGYVAISIRFLTLEYQKNGAYGWLRGYHPMETIGKSMVLYNINSSAPGAEGLGMYDSK
jgi:4-amino-4-deoxy-L-arabinose transferase-like glycosyltransferase